MENETTRRSGAKTDSIFWQKIWPLFQTIIGPLVVAAVIGLVAFGARVGTDISRLDDALKASVSMSAIHAVEAEHMSRELNSLKQFSEQGGRFTAAQGLRHDERIRQNDHELKRLDREFSNEIRRLEIALAKLPPLTWQARILELERHMSHLKGAMEGRDP